MLEFKSARKKFFLLYIKKKKEKSYSREQESERKSSSRNNKHAEEMFIDSERSKLSKHSRYVIFVLTFCLCHDEIYDQLAR